MSAHTDVQLGEAFVAPGVNAAHINTVLGPRGSAAETAWATSLATPSAGHERFVVIMRPGVPVQPFTVFVSKSVPVDDRHGRLIWGPAQAGVAAGVADAVAAGTIAAEQVTDLRLIVAVWVNREADDAEAVYRNNRLATATALANGRDRRPDVDTVLKTRGRIHNPFFTPADGGAPGTEPRAEERP
ncbi:formaldehyde-activating enzyme [Nocardia terpenica]|uniref:Formaldehyde-activating enzyme n=1 Tax=Nocardia terpenica TaxID=455432 RepID=A0A6G9Z5X1_9NOCA|nr:formaldehyde-activating enzyme [Nocardia terpenica]QIS20989.1 formaldehyde-activating enzyme [Nocardia terpenica]